MPRLLGGLLLVFALCSLALAAPIYVPFTTSQQSSSAVSAFAAQQGIVTVPEENEKNMFFTFELGIGTPEQTFKMMFDTTISETIVAGTDCVTKTCKKVDLFNADDSSSWTQTGNSSSVMIGSDDITIASATVTDSIFAVSSRFNFPSGFPKISGILGLSFSQYSRINAPSLFDDLVSQGAIDSGMFSIYLDSKSNDSVLIFGGTDQDLYTGPIHWRPLASNREWATRLVSITVNGNRVHYCPEPCRAIFSTADNHIYGPPVYVRKINNALNISLDCSNFWTLPRLVFHLGPHYLSIPPSSYVGQVKGQCKSQIRGAGTLKQNWILGNLFLRSYYTVFDSDNRRIGWAALPPTIISS